ncbi:MAG: DinB family protein [Acidobacteria bacterium]|nr:DinB family protein [Acidobacteriota bacterium]
MTDRPRARFEDQPTAPLAVQIQSHALALDMNLDGVSHADSLIQPPAGNCINWVLGHVVASRNGLLGLVERAPVWDDALAERYLRGSEAIGGEGDGVLGFDRIVADFRSSQQPLLEGLGALSVEQLAEPAELFGRPMDRMSKLSFLVFHEGYHLGQLGLLRRLLGKPGGIA